MLAVLLPGVARSVPALAVGLFLLLQAFFETPTSAVQSERMRLRNATDSAASTQTSARSDMAAAGTGESLLSCSRTPSRYRHEVGTDTCAGGCDDCRRSRA